MRTTWIAVLAFAFPLAAWSAGKPEEHLSVDQLPAPVKATIDKESAGGTLGEIEKETEHGRTFYEAEITKNGKASYVHVAQDGKLLKRERAAEERRER